MYTAFREIHLVLSYDFLLLIFIHILLQIFQDTEFNDFLIFYLCTVIDFFAPCLSILHTYVVAILAKLIKTFNETSLDKICIKYIHPVPPPLSLSFFFLIQYLYVFITEKFCSICVNIENIRIDSAYAECPTILL